MSSTRKKPFSSKKKKEQLKLKREKIRAQGRSLHFFVFFRCKFVYLGDKWADSDDESSAVDTNTTTHSSRRKLNEQPTRDSSAYNPNRFETKNKMSF